MVCVSVDDAEEDVHTNPQVLQKGGICQVAHGRQIIFTGVIGISIEIKPQPFEGIFAAF